MLHSEKLSTFNEQRETFRPYGLSCELWMPELMNKPDRHNEIEINFLTEGSITYLFQGSKIEIPAKSFALFWGLVPHQIVDYTKTTPYFVGTIPLTVFLEWKLPSSFVDRILKGEILIENTAVDSDFYEFMTKNWINDFRAKTGHKTIFLEMQARLMRMAGSILPLSNKISKMNSGDTSKVEQIALYIAQHYDKPIKAADISNEVGLHPDYANVVFKKAFGTTITDYIIQERISYAQRKLITSNKSITDILYESGFNSISRFNVAFRKINSCSPREFRKRYQ